MASNHYYKFSGLKLRQPDFDLYTKEPRGTVGQYMARRGKLIVAFAKRQVGVDTGLLRDSITMVHTRVALGQNMRIGSRLSHALVHHEGSRPHVIEPKNAGGMLRFTSKGRVVYSRQVMHPGTKPNRYLSDQLWIIKTL